MSESSMRPDDSHRPAASDPDLDIENDEVIGRAFRRSMQILAAVLLAGAGVWAAMHFTGGLDEDEESSIEAAAPETVASTSAEGPPALPFADIGATAGIEFVHANGATGDKWLPETMGSGAAFFDADNDGDADLLLVSGRGWDSAAAGTSSAFYRNQGDGTFQDATAAAGLTTDFYGTGVAIADYDGDGWLDIFIASVASNHLYQNKGDGSFRDVTAKAGIAGAEDTWSTSSTFADFDGDGDLDLFVGNYVRWSPKIDAEVDYRLTGVGRAYGPPVNYEGTFSSLFRNEGNGTFTDISVAAGLEIRNDATGVPVGKALGVATVDLDGDHHLDLMIANDTVRNFLFHNQGDGSFEEVGEYFGLAYGRSGEATGAMGIDAGHYRNDSDLGFVIGNFANEMSSLYMSQGESTLFVDEAITEGVGAPSRTVLTFGVLLFDVDLDGRLDLLQTNGHLENEIATVDPSQSYEQPSQLLWNAGPSARQTFAEVPLETTGDLAIPIVGRGSAYADIDGDGDLDVVLTQTGRRPLLLRNDQTTGHHWLRVRLSDETTANHHGIGALVELEAGGIVQHRQVMPSRSYQSSSELTLTFGLGAATSIDRLSVRWPNGDEQTVEVSALDSQLVVERK